MNNYPAVEVPKESRPLLIAALDRIKGQLSNLEESQYSIRSKVNKLDAKDNVPTPANKTPPPLLTEGQCLYEDLCNLYTRLELLNEDYINIHKRLIDQVG